jgi:DNA-binding NtrC family response regulator
MCCCSTLHRKGERNYPSAREKPYIHIPAYIRDMVDWYDAIEVDEIQKELMKLSTEEAALYLRGYKHAFELLMPVVRKLQKEYDGLLSEKDALVNALKTHNGNVQKAAEELGVSRQTVYARQKKYGIKLSGAVKVLDSRKTK